MSKKNSRVIILYSESDFTPWKENISADTLAAVMNAVSLNFKAAITHFTGFENSFASFLRRFDLVVNLCYGFDQYSQTDVACWLDAHSIQHTSSTCSAQLTAQDKAMLPALCSELGILTPELLDVNDVLSSGKTLILKPRFGSLHRGIIIFRDNEITIDEILNEENIIQPYIYGREFTVAVIPNKETDGYDCLPPVEIVPVNGDEEFIAGNAAGRTIVNYDPLLSESMKNKIMSQVLALHKRIGLRGISRTDLKICGDDIFILDVNSMPNLEPSKSFLPLIARHNHISFHELINRIINRFLNHYYSKENLVSVHY
jgi:D-alanine-D-alanine ligase